MPFKRQAGLVLLLLTGCATVTGANENTAKRAALKVPFKLRGHSGLVSIAYEENQDPAHWGFDLLNLPFDIEQTRGFPVFDARTHYDVEGLRAVMGWIQVVTVQPSNGEPEWTEPDQISIFRESDTPFFPFGMNPEAFDAPGPNPPRTDETWTAYTFLTFCPDIGRTRHVAALLGVRWGYVLKAGKPTLQPLEVVDANAWDKVLPSLKKTYPDWDFASGFAPQQ